MLSKIKIKYGDYRNLNRLQKWLKMECSFNGMFSTPNFWGYKTSDNDHLIFSFYHHI